MLSEHLSQEIHQLLTEVKGMAVVLNEYFAFAFTKLEDGGNGPVENVGVEQLSRIVIDEEKVLKRLAGLQ
ncbi:hypothetical protein scyTo_0022945, partial [Scyliorhinus torazame]|nr:hypothetical protein [Scyliorhinus torazame]